MKPVLLNSHRLHSRGFTLVELVVIIVVLGILAAYAIPKFSGVSESSKITATRQEMDQLKRAIVGNPTVVAGGALVDRGFLGDVGFVPSSLHDLIAKPDSVNSYDQLTRLGWNGPYIDSAMGKYDDDAWDNPYVYQPGSRRIISVGGADSIIVTF